MSNVLQYLKRVFFYSYNKAPKKYLDLTNFTRWTTKREISRNGEQTGRSPSFPTKSKEA